MPYRLGFTVIGFALHLLIAPLSHANLQTDYEEERSRILRKKYYDIYDALVRSTTFDIETPLGKYFYNSIVKYSHKGSEEIPLTASETRKLENNYPEIFLEYLIKENIESELNTESKIKSFETYSDIAKRNGWNRVYRYSMAWLVEFEIKDSRDNSALLRMYQLLDKVPKYENAEIAIDYPLQSLYYDMARSMNNIRMYSQSLKYCDMLDDFGPKNSGLYHFVTHCKIYPLLALNQADKALNLLYLSIDKAQQNDETFYLIVSYLYAAEILIEINSLERAENFVRDAISIQKSKDYDGIEGYANEYKLLARIYLKKGDIERAEHYLKLSEEQLPNQNDNLKVNLGYLNIRKGILEKRGNFEEAVEMSKKALNALRQKEQKFPSETLVALTSQFNSRQLNYLEKESDIAKRNGYLILLLAFLLFITLLGLIVVIIKTTKLKREIGINSMYDIASGALTFPHWKKTSLIHTGKRNGYQCVLLQLKPNSSLEEYETLTFNLIKTLKHQLHRSEIVGRYDATTFVIKMNTKNNEECEKRLHTLFKNFQYETQFSYRFAAYPFPDKLRFDKTLNRYVNDLQRMILVDEKKRYPEALRTKAAQ